MSDTPKKKTRRSQSNSSKAENSNKKAVRGKKAKLARIIDMPVDIFFEVGLFPYYFKPVILTPFNRSLTLLSYLVFLVRSFLIYFLSSFYTLVVSTSFFALSLLLNQPKSRGDKLSRMFLDSLHAAS